MRPAAYPCSVPMSACQDIVPLHKPGQSRSIVHNQAIMADYCTHTHGSAHVTSHRHRVGHSGHREPGRSTTHPPRWGTSDIEAHLCTQREEPDPGVLTGSGHWLCETPHNFVIKLDGDRSTRCHSVDRKSTRLNS